jgi:hypothetical protein
MLGRWTPASKMLSVLPPDTKTPPDTKKTKGKSVQPNFPHGCQQGHYQKSLPSNTKPDNQCSR